MGFYFQVASPAVSIVVPFLPVWGKQVCIIGSKDSLAPKGELQWRP